MIDQELEQPGIAIVRSSRPWARVLHRHVVDHGGAIVRTRPLELRQAIDDDYDVLIADDISSFLSVSVIEELHRRNRRILGVYDSRESSATEPNAGRSRLARMGVDGVVDADASPEEFVRLITELAPSASERAKQRQAFTGSAHQDIQVPQSSAAVARQRRGHITAIMAAAAGSGATEITLALARSLSQRGERTIAVDCDEVGPSVAQRLGLPMHPNLRTAIDVVEHGTGRLGECLITVDERLEVLVGLPHPKDWIEIRGPEISSLCKELSRGRPQIVVNTSPFFEDLSAYGGADRYAVTRAAVESADAVFIVSHPSPIGVARLLDRVADAASLLDGKAVHIVFNKAEKTSFKQKEILREIERNFQPTSVAFITVDSQVERAAWDGTLVGKGQFTKQIESKLATTIPKVITSKSKKRSKK